MRRCAQAATATRRTAARTRAPRGRLRSRFPSSRRARSRRVASRRVASTTTRSRAACGSAGSRRRTGLRRGRGSARPAASPSRLCGSRRGLAGSRCARRSQASRRAEGAARWAQESRARGRPTACPRRRLGAASTVRGPTRATVRTRRRRRVATPRCLSASRWPSHTRRQARAPPVAIAGAGATLRPHRPRRSRRTQPRRCGCQTN